MLAPIPFACSTILMVVISTVWLFTIDVPLGIVAIIVFPTFILMNLVYERAQALCQRVLAESGIDPSPAAIRRAWASTVSTMEGAPEIASLAMRVCGGRSLLRPSRLEQLYRDARCGATMLPWSVEVCLDRLGRGGLFDDAEEAPA